MRFLFFTDTHIRGTTPRNRKDNFYETLKNKFFEIKNIIENRKIDYILHGGDWFDRPDISPAIVRDFAVIVKSFEKPIYSIAGNHDIYGHNPDTLGRTMLGLLEGLGVIRMIKNNEEVFLESNGITVQITGKSYTYDIDGENFRDYYIVKKRQGVDYLINIVHGMLLKKPFFEGIQYTLINDILETEADITLAGHYHSGFGIDKVDSKYFANPGGLIRIANSLNEIKRVPKVLVIDVSEGIYIEELALKCALPGEEVLDRAQLELSHDRELKLNQFYRTITETYGYHKVDLNKIIDEIAADQKIDRCVRDEAIRRIGAADESLKTGNEEL